MLAKAFATDVAAAAATAVETAELEAEGGLDTIQVEPGQSLEEIKAKLKPKKQGISAEMLDTANSYEDKVALIRMIVTDEAGRVANVFKAMMARELNR
jgi:flagellar M-ring protein FliF